MSVLREVCLKNREFQTVEAGALEASSKVATLCAGMNAGSSAAVQLGI